MMRVLLVDDSFTIRRIMRNQLNKLGITDIIDAANGLEAITALKASMPVDLMLLDWNMPEMDGITCLKTIRTDPALRGVKVIMCTSEAERGHVIEALQAGAQDYLIKPIVPEILKQKLSRDQGAPQSVNC
jgi:two-component system chemotaxis response regulator CheY